MPRLVSAQSRARKLWAEIERIQGIVEQEARIGEIPVWTEVFNAKLKAEELVNWLGQAQTRIEERGNATDTE